ncbi:MAG TPA: hypothetical protein VMX11_01720 [Actinomycetes bacterium]|nr:hypothetical protein [Actinomycetes bacterium]
MADVFDDGFSGFQDSPAGRGAWQFILCGLVIAASLGGKASCSTSAEAKNRAIETLERDGYSDASTTGVRWLTCGDTIISTGFTATAPSGEQDVTGAVCCGAVVRGCSIRTD